MDEILRAIKAMKVTDTYQVAAPENWPYNKLIGSDLILPPADTIADAMSRQQEEACFDWCFCYRQWINNFDEI